MHSGPRPQALIHGLNRHYYSIAINYRKTPLEERMLGNLQVRHGRLRVVVIGGGWMGWGDGQSLAR